MSTPAELIKAYLEIEYWLDSELKRFESHLRPHREKQEALKAELQVKMVEEKVQSYKTEHGTAYQSTIVTPSIEGDKTEFLDWVLENWDQRGNMLQIGAPQKAALQEYAEANGGQLPPMVRTSTLVRVNIRRGS